MLPQFDLNNPSESEGPIPPIFSVCHADPPFHHMIAEASNGFWETEDYKGAGTVWVRIEKPADYNAS